MSRQGAPTRTRQRMPSMSWRRVNREGRPCRFRAGKQWFEPGPLGIGQIGSSGHRFHEVSGVALDLGRPTSYRRPRHIQNPLITATLARLRSL